MCTVNPRWRAAAQDLPPHQRAQSPGKAGDWQYLSYMGTFLHGDLIAGWEGGIHESSPLRRETSSL